MFSQFQKNLNQSQMLLISSIIAALIEITVFIIITYFEEGEEAFAYVMLALFFLWFFIIPFLSLKIYIVLIVSLALADDDSWQFITSNTLISLFLVLIILAFANWFDSWSIPTMFVVSHIFAAWFFLHLRRRFRVKIIG